MSRDSLKRFRAVDPLAYPLDTLRISIDLAAGRGFVGHAPGMHDPRRSGLLFVGYSGAGKTTLARLFSAAPGFRTLAGVCFLEHGERNPFRTLGPASAAARLFACAFPPLYRREAIPWTLEIRERVGAVPSHVLRFLPDGSAVDFVAAVLEKSELAAGWRGRGGAALRAGTREGVPRLGRGPDSLCRAGLLREVSTTLLSGGSPIRFTATGHSMHPTIRDGNVITVEPVAPFSIRFADVILYRAGTGAIAHRVIGKRRSGDGMAALLMRGDGSREPDEPVQEHQVLGKVVLVERGGRRLALGGWPVTVFHLARLNAYRLKRWMEGLLS